MTPRHATFAAFLAFGVSVGLWSGSVPAVALRAGITPAMMGLATTGHIASYVAGIAAGGVLARHAPIRRSLPALVALTAIGAALALQAAGPAAFAGLFLGFGFLLGLCDGTMNAEGTAVERDLGRPVLAGFHAASSFAAAAAAALGGALSVLAGTLATAAVGLAVAAAAVAVILSATPLRPVEPRRGAAGPRGLTGAGPVAHAAASLPVVPIVLVGLAAGFTMTGEAATLNFAASTLREQAPAFAAYAGLGVTAFGLCQACARTLVDRVRRRFADTDIILWSAALAGVGFAIVATGATAAQSIAGFAVIGVGTAAIVPCSFALAPRVSGLAAAQAIGLLSLISALPRIPQPLFFGEVAARFGFAAGFAINAALMVVAFALAMRLRALTRVATARTAGPVADPQP